MNAPDTDLTVSRTAPSDAHDSDALDIMSILQRQRWILIFFTAIGLSLGVVYALKSQIWYESTAKVLINQKSAGLSDHAASDMVAEDVLANHMEIIRSRRIVESALAKDGLMKLASIQPLLDNDEDTADYVIDRIEITKGGDGGAKNARSLNIAFSHSDPHESQMILESVLLEYQKFITDQLESVMSTANRLVSQAKDDVEKDLRTAEQDYLVARKKAPLLFQGEGSSNIYQDKYRRLEDELLNLEIEQASVQTRLDGVVSALESFDSETATSNQLDKLALIDSDSIERLALFAGLGLNNASSAEFQAAQPARMAEAQSQFTQLLKLMSERQRLKAVFGEGHPKVQDIDDEILLVQNFISEQQQKNQSKLGFSDEPIGPELLLRAYVGFLKHDLSAFSQRRKELEILSQSAESQAKTLIDFELEEQVLRNKITRQEALFDGVVHQLRELDTASGLSGYIYELLQTPRLGVKVWPKMSICGLGGLMLGLLAGLAMAVANDMRDGRFRSAAELDDAMKLPMLGRIGKLNSINHGIKGLIATELSPDAEAFRMGRTLLLPEIRSGKLQTLGMTSPMQSDGKSTVVSNFSVSASQVGLRVLVIDADLRRPSQHRYFSVDITGGVTDILKGTLAVEDAIKSTDAENVSIITAGSSTETPAELLQSPKLEEMLEQMKSRFDLIVVDMPPVLAVSDPLIVAPRLGGLIVVVRASTARRDEVANTLRRLRSGGGTLVGCILNTFGAGKQFTVSGGYYGYYESSYTRPKSPTRNPASRMAKPSSVNSIESRNGESS